MSTVSPPGARQRFARLGLSLAAALAAAAGAPGAAHAIGAPPPGALGPSTLKLPGGPGSIRGLADPASVNLFAAEVKYSVPIELPAAGGTFRPQLTLSYDGALGNGPLGIGWRMAFPEIRRSERQGVPHFDDRDELELVGLGGGRLVKLADGSFRVEGEGQAVRIDRSGAGFVVTDADGTRYTLGVSAAARRESGTRTVGWMAERMDNTAGRSIAFGYTRDQNEIYLSSITYGPRYGAAPAYRVDVLYEARPDAAISYRSGFRAVTAQRASRIQVSAFGEVLRTYVLAYDNSFALSRLSGVTMTGRAGATGAPPLSFSYAAREAAQVTPLATPDGWILNEDTTLVDVDGDAMVDMVRFSPFTGNQVELNHQGTFLPAVPMPGADGLSLQNARLVDVDGDTRPELAFVYEDEWQVAPIGANGIGAAQPWAGSGFLPLFAPYGDHVDLNGDGRLDVLVPVAEGGGYVYMGGAAGFEPAVELATMPADIVPGRQDTRFPDVNGDGLDDALVLRQDSLRIYLGTGDGNFVFLRDQAFPWTGTTLPADVFVADIDRDGLVDLVHASSGYVAVHAGLPAGGFATVPRQLGRPSGDDSLAQVFCADVNGNGSVDVVWSSSTGMWVLDLAGTTTAGMLVRVQNGLGLDTRFSYEASAVLARSAAAAGTPWTRNLPMSVPVPTVMQSIDVAGGPIRRIEYSVRNGAWDFVERRFAGFLVGIVREVGASAADTRVTTTSYVEGVGDSRVLRGRAERVSVTSGDGRQLSATENRWQALPVAGLTGSPLLRKATLASTRELAYEGVATPVETTSSYLYDAEARRIETNDRGRSDLVGDERITRKSYASDATTWVRDRVLEEKQLAGDGTTLIAWKRYLYGDDTRVLPAGQIGKGWLRQVDERLEFGTEARWVTTDLVSYDAFGNPVAETADGVTRRISYDPYGLFPVSESVDPAAGTTLTWTMAYDLVLGKPTGMTLPSGEVTRVTYDGLGRVTGYGLAGKPLHTIYSYDATGPAPRTTTYQFDGRLEALTAFTTWAPGSGWRQTVDVQDGAGEALYQATRAGASNWIVSGLATRDARGRVVARAQSFYAPSIDGLTTAPASVPVERIAYDAFDRRTLQTLPTGGTRRYAYSAFAQTETETDLAPVTERLDGLGRIVHTERTVNGVVEQVDASYDAASRIVGLSLQGGRVRSAFVYDTLGRLRRGQDPEAGVRTYGYDDGGRLLSETNAAGQTVTHSYDAAGRSLGAVDAAGTRYVYHYDVPRAGTTATGTRGRLAWVEEPTGTVDFGYDETGHQSFMRRIVNGKTGTKTIRFSPSGQVLSLTNDDGFTVDTRYDDAGRPVAVSDLWQATSLDAAGHVLAERYGNGVVETYERNGVGQSTRLRVVDPTGRAIYDVGLARSLMGRLQTVTDTDGVGLDHSASFTYDLASRLTRAEEGGAARKFVFTYGYDDLQNMVTRGATGPVAMNLLGGTYRYGESGATLRQLTSVTSPTGVVTRFAYDLAGRQTVDGDRSFGYDGFDQLTRVARAGVPVVDHAYGYDGQRVFTRGAAGDTQTWFTSDLVERAGVRQHYVRIAGRTIARVDRVPGGAAAASGAGTVAGLLGALPWAMLVLFLGGVAYVVVAQEPRRRLASVTAMLTLASFMGACVGTDAAHMTAGRSAVTAGTVLYFHESASAGSVLMTRASGAVADERRFEPYGEALEATRPGVAAGQVDFTVDPTNSLDKETDPATGLSYHGARWLNPRTARWTAVDPPTKAPDAAFMARPWELNPYQYVDSNPVTFWDPDGRQPVRCEADDGSASRPKAEEAAKPAAVKVAARKPTPAPVADTTATSTPEENMTAEPNSAGPYSGGYIFPEPTIPVDKLQAELNTRNNVIYRDWEAQHAQPLDLGWVPVVGPAIAGVACVHALFHSSEVSGKTIAYGCASAALSIGPMKLAKGGVRTALEVVDMANSVGSMSASAFEGGDGSAPAYLQAEKVPYDANMSPEDPYKAPVHSEGDENQDDVQRVSR